MNGGRVPRIGVIGTAGIDAEGMLSGSARLASLIAALGAETAFAGLVEPGPRGTAITARLHDDGVDVSRIEVSVCPSIALGDKIDIAGLFAMDAVVIAVADVRLHRFLVDLPVHTAPNARLTGLVADLAGSAEPEALEIALGHDLIVATAEEVENLTGIADTDAAVNDFQRRMTGKNLRFAAVHQALTESLLLTKTDRFAGPSTDFERFTAAAAVVFAERRPWSDLFTAKPNQ